MSSTSSDPDQKRTRLITPRENLAKFEVDPAVFHELFLTQYETIRVVETAPSHATKKARFVSSSGHVTISFLGSKMYVFIDYL